MANLIIKPDTGKNKTLAEALKEKKTQWDMEYSALEATKVNEILPRVAHTRDYFSCKYCEFQDTWWAK